MSGELGRQELEWLDFVWANMGRTVAVTFERAGVEKSYQGWVVCHASGTYSIGSDTFTPGYEGVPVRWTVVSKRPWIDVVAETIEDAYEGDSSAARAAAWRVYAALEHAGHVGPAIAGVES